MAGTSHLADLRAREFTALSKRIRACERCNAHLPLTPNPLFQAHPDARILVAAQAPGIRAHQTSLTFNDPSGERLRDWMGIDRDSFYDPLKIAIAPMGFCYPGSTSRGDLPPRPECATAWRDRLLAALPQIELTLVIGIYAQRYHLGGTRKASLTETVRNWRDYWPRYAALPHPSPRNNGWLKKNPWFSEQLLPELRQAVGRLLDE